MHLEQREPPLSTSTQVPSLAKRTRLTHAKRVLPFFPRSVRDRLVKREQFRNIAHSRRANEGCRSFRGNRRTRTWPS